MKTRLFYSFFAFALLLALLAQVSGSAEAQAPVSTPTPVSVLQANTPVPGSNLVNFYEIVSQDIELVGPLDFASLTFGLPADWRLTGPAELTLNLAVSLNTISITTTEGELGNFGGLLSLEFNRNEIGTFPLNESGETTLRVQIPLEYLKSVRADGRQELTFSLDSGLSCLINQQMILAIHVSSNLNFPHEVVKPDTSLVHFPFPLYQNSIFPDTALLLIPDNPSEAELQSAVTLSAGLSNLTGSRLLMDLSTYGTVKPNQLTANHVILIGRAESIPLLPLLQLPLPPVNGKFSSADRAADDGYVEMANSPWNQSKVVLVVSGDTEAGVVKAAQAVSTGVLRPNSAGNLSIVEDVSPSVPVITSNNDQSLADLGYSSILLERRGTDSATIRFNLPPGWTAGSDAYFELAYGHSALLDYNRSGLIVEVNGQPVGSVRFTDGTASKAVNRVQISIPASVLVAGLNTIDLISSLYSVDVCSSPSIRGLWVNIWPDSVLHLPLVQMPANIAPVFDLREYPAPLTFDPTLGDVAFVLQRDNVDSWRYALQTAAYLGDRSNGAIALPQVFYADSVPDSARASSHLVLIGDAKQMPIVQELNEYLPAPFEASSGLAVEKNMQVTFRIAPASPLGYIELLQSPWNKQRVIIAALGNTPQGVAWGAAGLFESRIRSSLAGNFAVINDQQVVTTDTRLAPPAVLPSSTSAPGIEIIPPSPIDPSAVSRPAWILPALIASLTLMIAIIVGVIYVSRSQNRSKENEISSNVNAKSGEE